MKTRYTSQARTRTFYDVAQQQALTSQGKVDVPMLFRDSSARMLVYQVELDAARDLLKHTGLVAVEFARGRAAAALVYYDYRRVGIGPYREVVLAIVVQRPDRSTPRWPLRYVLRKESKDWGPIGAYVVDMPVTIPQARAAGLELWGFPKFVTRIDADLSGRDFSFSVAEPGGAADIVRIRGRRGPGLAVPASDLVTYSNHAGTILRTSVDTRARMTLSRARVRIEIGACQHPMAQHLRALRLDELKPLLAFSCDDFSSRLPFGVPILDWPMTP